MQQHECALRALNICDGSRAVVDPLRPHQPVSCICMTIAAGELGDDALSELRWVRARAVARAQRIQRAIEVRRHVDRFGGF